MLRRVVRTKGGQDVEVGGDVLFIAEIIIVDK
jgi:hypothetical protein